MVTQTSSSQRDEKLKDAAPEYDPDQNPEEKEKIRMGYREQIRDLEERGKDLKTLQISDIIDKINTADEAFGEVRAPQEAMFDSRLLNLAATLSTAKVRELRHDGGGFDTGDFIAKMVTFMGGNRAGINDADSDVDDQFEIDLDWKKLGWRSLAYSRRAVGVDAMLGPLSFEQKKREVKKRSKQEKDDAPIVQPVEIKAEEIEKDENETSNNVLELSKMINSVASNQSVNLFKIIINPHSYSQSVENLFYLSFLIHEQRVAVEVDPQTDELMLYACEPATEDDYKDSDLRRVQSVWELDYETWQMAIETWDIREPLFPTRPTPPESSYRFYNK